MAVGWAKRTFRFAHLMRDAVSWIVVEQAAMAALAGEIEDVTITDQLPKTDDSRGALRIGFARTALQYFSDPIAPIRSLAEAQMEFLVFVRLAAGTNPAFVSVEKSADTSLPTPVYFLNFDSFVSAVEELGYRLIFRCGDNQEFPMSNFPQTHRVERSVTAVFARRDVALNWSQAGSPVRLP
ncbi:MAG: hypothetical protein EXR02_05340 [Rhodospirillales bacterium]|nr:hypothetical protein [Rhodospirillales bacterium]